ncbi:serine/threonine protein kinase [Bryocella elongata]|uniref:Serine/threonine protein kinase n=1 Tax=Bryocella elongata TaxID=863522 RepID=A0A1H5UUN3_9BACT|nr:serine/threonine-protein kinase [Bryocella elongata]SEF78775.1 serine/threonine protein kinase [Bryocella elongata]
MDSQRWQRIQHAFFSALDLPEDEREAAIRDQAGDDKEFIREVLALLANDSEPHIIVDHGIAAIAVTMLGAAQEEFASMEFGPYELRDFLGEGGMGIVYLARHRGNGKIVAIKILLDARLSPARYARFVREQRMLASLNHRNIAQLFHSDVLSDETPWFAMELIGSLSEESGVATKALPIDEFCREHHCTLDDRLRLMRSVCDGVQHVHSTMLVHRDLKPSNILVTEDGTPKLIDFGIGKEQEDEDASAKRTEPGLRLMTLAYAAPEQVRGAPALPATGIYSLGVVLYELIAGCQRRHSAMVSEPSFPSASTTKHPDCTPVATPQLHPGFCLAQEESSVLSVIAFVDQPFRVGVLPLFLEGTEPHPTIEQVQRLGVNRELCLHRLGCFAHRSPPLEAFDCR